MLLDIIHTVCCEKDCFLKVGKKDIAAIINYELCSTIIEIDGKKQQRRRSTDGGAESLI